MDKPELFIYSTEIRKQNRIPKRTIVADLGVFGACAMAIICCMFFLNYDLSPWSLLWLLPVVLLAMLLICCVFVPMRDAEEDMLAHVYGVYPDGRVRFARYKIINKSLYLGGKRGIASARLGFAAIHDPNAAEKALSGDIRFDFIEVFEIASAHCNGASPECNRYKLCVYRLFGETEGVERTIRKRIFRVYENAFRLYDALDALK